MQQKIVIVGAGHAGGTLASALRQSGHTGTIMMVGEEPLLPYQRPPLSKAWLKGEVNGEALALRAQSFYDQNEIELVLSMSVHSIDRTGKVIVLGNGRVVPYDVLVLATGARPVRLGVPGADLDGIHELRTALDAERLKSDLGPNRTLAVIGGGYIGLEVAASAVALGASAVVVEREPRLLARSGSVVLADFYRNYHEARGVNVLVGSSVAGFASGTDCRLGSVLLANGAKIDCDAALVGVGVIPNDALAIAAGLDCQRGINVDLEAKTSDPAIYAIGDCARRPIPLYNIMFCAESVPNALEQARQAAASILGKPAPAAEVPWNWSDQYDLKLQVAGLHCNVTRTVVRGNPEFGSFAVFHLDGDRVQQVEAVNSPGEFFVARQLILSRTPVDIEKLGRSDISMRDVGK